MIGSLKHPNRGRAQIEMRTRSSSGVRTGLPLCEHDFFDNVLSCLNYRDLYAVSRICRRANERVMEYARAKSAIRGHIILKKCNPLRNLGICGLFKLTSSMLVRRFQFDMVATCAEVVHIDKISENQNVARVHIDLYRQETVYKLVCAFDKDTNKISLSADLPLERLRAPDISHSDGRVRIFHYNKETLECFFDRDNRLVCRIWKRYCGGVSRVWKEGFPAITFYFHWDSNGVARKMKSCEIWIQNEIVQNSFGPSFVSYYGPTDLVLSGLDPGTPEFESSLGRIHQKKISMNTECFVFHGVHPVAENFRVGNHLCGEFGVRWYHPILPARTDFYPSGRTKLEEYFTNPVFTTPDRKASPARIEYFDVDGDPNERRVSLQEWIHNGKPRTGKLPSRIRFHNRMGPKSKRVASKEYHFL